VLSVVGKSVVYIKYSEGPNTLPCGSPDFASLQSEHTLLYFTWKYLF
jgi:hypothetical protein